MKFGLLLLFTLSGTTFAANGWGVGGVYSGDYSPPVPPGRDPTRIALGEAFAGIREAIRTNSREILEAESHPWEQGDYRYKVRASWVPGDGDNGVEAPPTGTNTGPSDQDLAVLMEDMEETMGLDRNNNGRHIRQDQVFKFYDLLCRGGRILISILPDHLILKRSNGRNATISQAPFHASLLNAKPNPKDGRKCKRSVAGPSTCRDGTTMISLDSMSQGISKGLSVGIGKVWLGAGVICFAGFGIPTANCVGNSGTTEGAPYKMRLERDGNLCIYNKDKVNTWCSGKTGKADGLYRASLQYDGNFVVYYMPGNKPIWATNTVRTTVRGPEVCLGMNL